MVEQVEQILEGAAAVGITDKRKLIAFALGFSRAARRVPKSDGPFEVYYYEAFSGRGHALEAMLAHAGKKYVLKGKAEMIEDSKGTCFAPAAIRVGDRVFAQLPCAMRFLGDQLGGNYMVPEEFDHDALKISLDIADVWSEMYSKRRGFKSWDEADEFVASRLTQWFTCLEKSTSKYSGEGPYFFGSYPTWVDFQFYNLARLLESCYGPDRIAVLEKVAPKTFGVFRSLHSDEKLASFLKTERPTIYPSARYTAKFE